LISLLQIAAAIGVVVLASKDAVAPVRAHVHLIPHAMETPVSGVVVARSVSDSSDIRELALHGNDAGGSLPRGDWFVSAKIENSWSEPVLFRVANDDSSVDLPVYAWRD
jgi:hypothetical protein